jgi:hypothetical protein
MKTLVLALLTILSVSGIAQVDEIRSASNDNSSSGGEGSGRGSRGENVGFFVDFFFNGVVQWQAYKLESYRERYPSMVSMDIMFQGAVKPSSYYMLWPRIRGNGGLFSTDFRMNYLIEDDIDGYKHIRTNDWQILQLNLITSKYIMVRVGSGIMTEAFESKRRFNETSFMFDFHAPDLTKVIGFEYRFAKDWNTGVNPRRELSVQYQHQVLIAGALHGYLSAGVTYQKYYNSIEVWGMQGGLIFRIF